MVSISFNNHRNRVILITVLSRSFGIIEIDNDERGVIGDFTTIRDIRIMKVEPERF